MSVEKIDEFDALIVGSGISGVLIAKRLGEANKSVLILEAGPGLPPGVERGSDREVLTCLAMGLCGLAGALEHPPEKASPARSLPSPGARVALQSRRWPV